MLITESDTPIIDFAANPAPWGHRVLLRGVVCPLLPPQDVDADNDPWVRSGLFGVAIGLFARGWSMIVGRTPLSLARERVARLLPPTHRAIAASLTGAECLMLDATYTGLQRAWHQHYVAAALAARGKAGTGDSFAGHVVAPASSASNTPSVGGAQAVMIPIPPGGRLPQWLGGQRVGGGRDDASATLTTEAVV